MKKKLNILTIVIMLCLSTGGYAVSTDEESIDVGNTQVPNTLKLSIQEASDYAIEHNRDVKIQEINIKKSELLYEQNKKALRNYDEYKSLSDTEKENLLNAMNRLEIYSIVDRKMYELGIVKKTMELPVNIAKWNREIKLNEIKYNVEKEYYDLLQAEEERKIANEGLELAKLQYAQSKKMHELGTISAQQLLAIELGVSQAQAGYDAVNMVYELQKMNFNSTLGLPLYQDIELTDKIEIKQHEEININKSIEEAFNNNAVLKVSDENYEIEKLTLQAVSAKSSENTYKYREQEIAVEQAAKNLEMTQNGIEMAVRSAYLNLITSEKQIKTYEMAVEKAQKSLELAQISFELGQNTANDVTQARIELMDAKKELSKQIHAYNMALLDFKYSTGLGKTLIGA